MRQPAGRSRATHPLICLWLIATMLLVSLPPPPPPAVAEAVAAPVEAEAASWGRLRWAWVGAEETENGRAYRYDARGRVVADTLWVAGVGYTTTYAYDSGDRVTALTYPDGEVVSHEYDDEGAGCFVSG